MGSYGDGGSGQSDTSGGRDSGGGEGGGGGGGYGAGGYRGGAGNDPSGGGGVYQPSGGGGGDTPGGAGAPDTGGGAGITDTGGGAGTTDTSGAGGGASGGGGGGYQSGSGGGSSGAGSFSGTYGVYRSGAGGLGDASSTGAVSGGVGGAGGPAPGAASGIGGAGAPADIGDVLSVSSGDVLGPDDRVYNPNESGSFFPQASPNSYPLSGIGEMSAPGTIDAGSQDLPIGLPELGVTQPPTTQFTPDSPQSQLMPSSGTGEPPAEIALSSPQDTVGAPTQVASQGDKILTFEQAQRQYGFGRSQYDEYRSIMEGTQTPRENWPGQFGGAPAPGLNTPMPSAQGIPLPSRDPRDLPDTAFGAPFASPGQSPYPSGQPAGTIAGEYIYGPDIGTASIPSAGFFDTSSAVATPVNTGAGSQLAGEMGNTGTGPFGTLAGDTGQIAGPVNAGLGTQLASEMGDAGVNLNEPGTPLEGSLGGGPEFGPFQGPGAITALPGGLDYLAQPGSIDPLSSTDYTSPPTGAFPTGGESLPGTITALPGGVDYTSSGAPSPAAVTDPWNLGTIVPFRAPGTDYLTFNSPAQGVPIGSPPSVPSYPPLTGPAPGEPGFADQFLPPPAQLGANITPPAQQPSLDEIQKAFDPQFGPPAPAPSTEPSPGQMVKITPDQMPGGFGTGISPQSLPGGTQGGPGFTASPSQSPGGGTEPSFASPGAGGPSAPASTIEAPTQTGQGTQWSGDPSLIERAAFGGNISEQQAHNLPPQAIQSVLQTFAQASAPQVQQAVNQLNPAQQQQVAAYGLGLLNEWRQVFLTQGIPNPEQSPGWSQVLTNVQAQTGQYVLQLTGQQATQATLNQALSAA